MAIFTFTLKGILTNGIGIEALLFVTALHSVSCLVQQVDMEGRACDSQKIKEVNSGDRYEVFANPRTDIRSGRNYCNIKFRTHPNGRIAIESRDVKIDDCGTSIQIFDGDEFMKKAKWKLGCSTAAGKVYKSDTNFVIIRLEKQSAGASQSYNYRLIVFLIEGDSDLDDESADMSNTLSAGALAGIGVGIAAVVLVFVALIIWCCIRYMRQGEEKRAQSVQSVHSTASSKQHPVASKPVEVFIGVENKEPYAARKDRGHDNMAYRHSSQSSDENDAPVSHDPRGGRTRSSGRRSRYQENDNQRTRNERQRTPHVEFKDEQHKTNGIVKHSDSNKKEYSEKQKNGITINRREVGEKVKQEKNTQTIQYHDNFAFESESDVKERRSRSPTRSSDYSHTRSYSPSQDTSKQSESVDSSEMGVGCHFRRNNQRSSTRSRSSSRARSNRRRQGGSLTRSNNSRSRSQGHHRHRSSHRSRSRSRSRSPAVKYHDRQSYADDHYTSRTTNI